MSMRIVSFTAQKGGVSKTSTGLGLACAASREGLRVAVLDLDPQASAAEWGAGRTTWPGVSQLNSAQSLPDALDAARRQKLDWLVLDTPPRADALVGQVAAISDLIVVPTAPAILDVRAIRPTLSALWRAGAHTRSHLLLTLCPPRTNPGADPPSVVATRLALDEAYGAYFRIAPVRITRYEGVKAALERSCTVIESEPQSKAAAELMALYSYVRDALSGTASDGSLRFSEAPGINRIRP